MKWTLILALILAAPRVARADDARDFDAEVKLFYRVVACGGDDAVDAKIAKVVAAHCKLLAKDIEKYKKRFVVPGTAWFAKVQPSGLGTQVVYPFGGGDLATALVVYPQATEVTTLSLEHAGDPTRLSTLTAKQLKKYLGLFRTVFHDLMDHTDLHSEKLRTIEKGPIPGQLAFFVTGAALMGYEPVHLRYFHVNDDGSLAYYTGKEIDDLADKKAKRASKGWVDTDWSVAFSNSELELRKVDDPSHTVVHRHFAANLDDEHFAGSGVQKHLEAKGKVPMIIKAASYLLWMHDSFAAITTYVATHLTWMVSDASGLAPADADANGLVQETYGKFDGADLHADRTDDKALIKLFKKQKQRKAPFRFGYRDKSNQNSLELTYPK